MDLKKVAEKLAESLSPEELGLLYFNIESVISDEEPVSDFENKICGIVDKA